MIARFPFAPFVVTPVELGRHWSGAKDGRWFRCHLCGQFFKEGETVRDFSPTVSSFAQVKINSLRARVMATNASLRSSS